MNVRDLIAVSRGRAAGTVVALLAAWTLLTSSAGAAVPQWLFAIGHAKALAVSLVSPKVEAPLAVTSPAFRDGGVIPCRNTQYCGNVFPGVKWSAGPAGTLTYAVIMEGPGEGALFSIHIMAYNIPASLSELPPGMTAPPAGVTLGANVHGYHHTYAGPHPHGKRRNEYHIQVFALDTPLHVSRSVTFDELIAAMKGHVLADGLMVGFASKPVH